MRAISLGALLLLALSQAPSPTGSIEGVVQLASTKEGIADVQITINSPRVFNPATATSLQDFRAGTQTVGTLQTDASGHFELKNLIAGTYGIQAQREGYLGEGVNQFSGVARPVSTETVTVTRDKTTRVTVFMTRGATVSGRVIDSNGNSVSNITVAAFQKAYQDGKATLLSIVTKQTDDHGEYRLFWLNPGKYYVGVLPGADARFARGPLPAGTSVSHPSFYPGVLDARTATPIEVVEGANVQGIDISQQSVTGVTISGAVDNTLPNIPAGPRGQPPNLGASQFFLVPLDPTALTLSNVAPIRNPAGRGGTSFQISGVLPGSYDLIAVVNDEQGNRVPGRTKVDVGNQNINGVTIPIRPGVEVKGHFALRGNGTAAVYLPNLRVLLRTTDGTLANAVGAPNAFGPRGRGSNVTSVQNPTEFSYPSVPDGHYGIQVTALPPNAYVEDIREGALSIFDSGLTIANGKAPGEIQIVINSDGETITGIVLDASQKPIAATSIALVPDQVHRENASLYKSSISSPMGRFTMTGIAPGDYKLFAWEIVPNGAWQNAEFIAGYEVLGTPIKVMAGGLNNIQLRVISADK